MLDRAMNGGEYAVTRSIISIQRRSTWLSKIKRKSNEGEFFRNESCGKKNRIKDLISTIITAFLKATVTVQCFVCHSVDSHRNRRTCTPDLAPWITRCNYTRNWRNLSYYYSAHLRSECKYILLEEIFTCCIRAS